MQPPTGVNNQGGSSVTVNRKPKTETKLNQMRNPFAAINAAILALLSSGGQRLAADKIKVRDSKAGHHVGGQRVRMSDIRAKIKTGPRKVATHKLGLARRKNVFKGIVGYNNAPERKHYTLLVWGPRVVAKAKAAATKLAK